MRNDKTRSIKAKSQKEMLIREHQKIVRQLQKWAERNCTTLKNFDEADAEDICVASRNDYELEDERHMILEDNDSWFLTLDDFTRWKN